MLNRHRRRFVARVCLFNVLSSSFWRHSLGKQRDGEHVIRAEGESLARSLSLHVAAAERDPSIRRLGHFTAASTITSSLAPAYII